MAKKPAKLIKADTDVSVEAQPQYKVEYREIQPYGTLKKLPIALEDNARAQSVATLNQVLADTMTIRDMYKKHHWQMSGATFYQLHLLLDKHYEEQAELMDSIAERIQTLGGVTVALPGDVASESEIARAPRGRESARAQLDRLANGHETILLDARPLGRAADDDGDDGTNDLIVSEIVRTNELQSWFIVQHLSRQSELGDVQAPAAEA